MLDRNSYSLLSPFFSNSTVEIQNKDKLIHNTSFLFRSSSVYHIYFTDAKDKIDLDYGNTFTRYLKRINNLRITYSDKKLLLFDNNVSRAFKYIKYYLNVATSYSFDIKNDYISLGGIFSSNVIEDRQKIVTKFRCKLTEYYQTLPNINSIIVKCSNLLDLIKIHKDIF